jgi:hypothetical protein
VSKTSTIIVSHAMNKPFIEFPPASDLEFVRFLKNGSCSGKVPGEDQVDLVPPLNPGLLQATHIFTLTNLSAGRGLNVNGAEQTLACFYSLSITSICSQQTT